LPLLDESGRPNANGFTARCPCEIFVREDDLNRFVATLSKSNATASSKVRASKKQIEAVVTDYRRNLPPGSNPSMPGVEKFARSKGLKGHRPEVRDEYHRQFPDKGAGRPSK